MPTRRISPSERTKDRILVSANLDEPVASAPTTAQDTPALTQPWSRQNYLAGGSKFQPRATALPSFNVGLVRRAALLVAAVALLAGLGMLGFRLAGFGQWDITVNNQQVRVPKDATVAQAIEAAAAPTQAGKLYAIDGSVISESGGGPFRVQVNGQEAQPSTVLADEAVVSVLPGEDQTEPSTTLRLAAAYAVYDDGTWGAFHQVVCDDPDAQRVVEVGDISGIEVERQQAAYETEAVMTRYSVHPQDKVMALTFDDGPWDPSTAQILDILAENDAKATFFVVGTCFDGDPTMSALVKREVDEGHQVCTHTYTHAAGEGLSYDLGLMSPDAQKEEVSKGQQAISNATGRTASRMIRAPGGNYTDTTALYVLPYVSHEIGWDIDSKDWQKPGKDAIVSELMAAQPGNIILMHDGGGDRSQTVEALQEALPKLRQEGWSFVTVEDLLAYHHDSDESEYYDGDYSAYDAEYNSYETEWASAG